MGIWSHCLGFRVAQDTYKQLAQFIKTKQLVTKILEFFQFTTKTETNQIIMKYFCIVRTKCVFYLVKGGIGGLSLPWSKQNKWSPFLQHLPSWESTAIPLAAGHTRRYAARAHRGKYHLHFITYSNFALFASKHTDTILFLPQGSSAWLAWLWRGELERRELIGRTLNFCPMGRRLTEQLV